MPKPAGKPKLAYVCCFRPLAPSSDGLSSGSLTFYGQLAVIGHSDAFVRVDDAAVAARVALGRVLHVESANEAPVVPRFRGFHRRLPSADALFRIKTRQKRTTHTETTRPGQSGSTLRVCRTWR